MSTRKLLFRLTLKLISLAHVLLYQASGGRVGGKIWGLPVLLLTTTGRRSGKARTKPLCFLAHGRSFVVVASNGGMDWFPLWWRNLVGEPRAVVQVGRTRTSVQARKAAPAERARLWAEITSIAPGYLGYEQRTRREIPLAILEPSDG